MVVMVSGLGQGSKVPDFVQFLFAWELAEHIAGGHRHGHHHGRTYIGLMCRGVFHWCRVELKEGPRPP